MISVVTLSPASLLSRLADLSEAEAALSLFCFHVPARSSCLLLDLPPPRGSPFQAATAKQLARLLGCSAGVRVEWSNWSGRWSRAYLVPMGEPVNGSQLSLPRGVCLPRNFRGTLPLVQLLGSLEYVC